MMMWRNGMGMIAKEWRISGERSIMVGPNRTAKSQLEHDMLWEYDLNFKFCEVRWSEKL